MFTLYHESITNDVQSAGSNLGPLPKKIVELVFLGGGYRQATLASQSPDCDIQVERCCELEIKVSHVKSPRGLGD